MPPLAILWLLRLDLAADCLTRHAANRLAELSQPSAKRPCYLWQPLRAKHEQRDHADEQQVDWTLDPHLCVMLAALRRRCGPYALRRCQAGQADS